MDSSWKWKAWCVIGVTFVSLYLLVPSVFHFDQQWTAAETAGQSVPWHLHLFPRKALTLGLDLQGGIYVEMQVELQDAVRRKTDLLGSRLTRDLKEKGVTVAELTQPSGGQLQFRLASQNDLTILDTVLRSYYPDVFQRPGTKTETAGTTVTLTFEDGYRSRLISQTVRQAVESVRNRIDRYGVGEPDIRLQGSDRIAIELPGLRDPDRALDIIKRTGQLEFRMVDDAKNTAELEQWVAEGRTALQSKTTTAPPATLTPTSDFTAETVRQLNALLKPRLPENTELVFELVRDRVTHKVMRGIPYLVSAKAEVTGDLLESASVDTHENEPRVLFSFDKTGTKLFGDLTKAHVGHRLAIILDGNLMSAPQIREPILQGNGQITLGAGDFNTMLREAQDLTLVLQEGALPASLTEATKTVVGPSLGADLIRQGFLAMAGGALAVILFMMFYYKLSGLLADAAVILNIVMLLGILAFFGATLTLPGIAGIVLTIGMAVDANVIINERIREELRSGKSVKAALQSGYANANRAVIDSNVTTLIAGIVLYQFGTGPIRGFAVTLSVGILTTLFTAVVFTRLIYDYVVRRWNPERLSI